MQVAVVYLTRQVCASGTARRPDHFHRRDARDVTSTDHPYVVNDDPLKSPDPSGENDQGFLDVKDWDASPSCGNAGFIDFGAPFILS
jgi:hypothetical protein